MKTIKKLCQATLNLVLAISMVFSTGIMGVFADEISTELQDAIESQENFIATLSVDIELYQRAIELVGGAEELNSDDQTAVNEYLDYLIENATTEDDANALRQMKLLISDANDLNQNYLRISEDEKTQYNNNLSMLIAQNINDNDIDELAELYANIITIIPDVNLGPVLSEISSVELSTLFVNGLELDVTQFENTVYVGYSVTDLEVVATPVTNTAKVKVVKPNPLEVGNNQVRVIVSTLSGEPVEYVLNVVRLGQFDEQGDGQDEKNKTTSNVEPMVSTSSETEENIQVITYSTSNYSSVKESTSDDETKVTSEKEDKKEYDEEIEKSGLNGFTVLLIVGGIALIGFGIYMLFGDKEDIAPVTNKTQNNKTNTKKKK